MKHILIIGGPKTGKTVAARYFQSQNEGMTVRATDDLKDMNWSVASDVAAGWISELSHSDTPVCIEGVAVVRALRKWLALDSLDRAMQCKADPVNFEVIALDQPYAELSAGQLSMTKGIATVFEQVLPVLHERGVVISFNPTIPEPFSAESVMAEQA